MRSLRSDAFSAVVYILLWIIIAHQRCVCAFVTVTSTL